jgi:glycosyltransferase involved in cell wall biosynthesis
MELTRKSEDLPVFSVIIPIYLNSGNIAPLLDSLKGTLPGIPEPAEVVFVVDGSPDDSAQRLLDALPNSGLRAQVILLSRNFGSFNAIRVGLEHARGDRFAAIAADLQEPMELLVQFQSAVAKKDVDVAFGRRRRRADPALRRAFSSVFWWLFRRLVMPEIPEGGVDVFACTRRVRDVVLSLGEGNTSLVGQLVWIGYKREFIDYHRRPRVHGASST